MLTLIRRPFHPRVTAVARKRLRSFCQKCRWQVTPEHALTLDLTKSESELTMPLCRLSVGKEMSSHATRQGPFGHSRLSSLSHCGLILPKRVELVCESESPLKKKKKSTSGEWIVEHSSQSPGMRGKSHHHITTQVSLASHTALGTPLYEMRCSGR